MKMRAMLSHSRASSSAAELRYKTYLTTTDSSKCEILCPIFHCLAEQFRQQILITS